MPKEFFNDLDDFNLETPFGVKKKLTEHNAALIAENVGHQLMGPKAKSAMIKPTKGGFIVQVRLPSKTKSKKKSMSTSTPFQNISVYQSGNAVWVKSASVFDGPSVMAFIDEIEKIATTAYLFRDPVSYKERAKVRDSVKQGITEHGKNIRGGKAIGAGGGALLGGAGGALAGYAGSGGKALPSILAGLAGAAGGGTAGYFGGRHLGRKRGLSKLKARGIHAVKVKDTDELRKVLRPALQQKGVDVVMQGNKAYNKKDLTALSQKMLSRVGAPDPAVLKSLGLPTLK